MSFRKKNIVLGVPAAGAPEEFASKLGKGHAPGIRPSPLDGRLTISTGTASLDQCLSGHAGLPLGNAILLEESGTTDFSGVVLKYYAAEGLVQGHHVHVFGVGDAWRSELPGLSQLPRTSKVRNSNGSDDKMKIAWRYESLSRGGEPPNSSMGEQHITDAKSLSVPFCHTFDLTTKLESRDCKGDLDVIRPTMPTTPKHTAQKIPSLLQLYTVSLAEAMRSSPQGSVHRVVVPNLLSPASYGPSTSKPSEVLQFLHALRALLRKYGSRLSAMISVSTALYSRSTGLVRWMEALLDGVVELVPLQQPVHAQPGSKSDDAAQGMLNIHRLPVFGELGIGPGGRLSQENLSFKLSSSSGLVIKPYSLPPVGDTADANDAGSTDTKR